MNESVALRRWKLGTVNPLPQGPPPLLKQCAAVSTSRGPTKVPVQLPVPPVDTLPTPGLAVVDVPLTIGCSVEFTSGLWLLSPLARPINANATRRTTCRDLAIAFAFMSVPTSVNVKTMVRCLNSSTL